MMTMNKKNIWRSYCKLWQELFGWKLFLFYILHYTVVFFLFGNFIFSFFIENGKSLVTDNDGICSYFPRMTYISKTIRDGIQALLNGEGWRIPLYDFRIGPARLDLQVEPLQWLAVLFPWDKLDILYDMLLLFRYYLVGLSFSVMGFYFGQKPLPVLIGALSYTFCGQTFIAGFNAPWFLPPVIFLPILIIGAENLLKGKKSLLFTFTVFLSMVSSLYFSCMLAILILIYISIRFFCSYNNNGVKGVTQMFARILLYGGCGILLSGIVALPTLLQMLDTGRIGRDIGILWYYSADYYESSLTDFMLIPGRSHWHSMGYSILSLPAIALMFIGIRKNKLEKNLGVLFVILTILYCIPAFSYVMSGFNIATDRWWFAYSLLLSSIIMFEIPKLQEKNKKVLSIVASVILAYMTFCYFIVDKNNYHEEVVFMLLISFILFAVCYWNGKTGRKFILPLCLFITFVSLYYTAFLKCDINQQNLVSAFVDNGSIYSIYEDGQYASLGTSNIVRDDSDFFRVSASDIHTDTTLSFYWDLNALSFYTSAYIDSYKILEDNLEIIQKFIGIWKKGIDGRAPVLSLLNVKYYVVRDNTPIPYGFTEVDRVDKDIILRNDYFLPVGYTYSSYIDDDSINDLSPVEKQELMLQSVVLSDETGNISVPENDTEIISKKITWDVYETNGLTWNEKILEIDKENATMTLAFNGLPNADTYLRVINLDLNVGTSTRRWDLNVANETYSTFARFSTDAYMYTHGLKTQLLYLGNSPDGYTTCTLTFPQKGTFMLDDLEIWCQPMDNYVAQIEALRAEPLENIEINWRGLTGTVELSKDKIMCFGIPYETGWSVYVDGEKRKLMQANIGLMAVELESGHHDIELKYWLSGLTAGIIMTLAGVIAVCGIVIYNKRNKLIKKTKSV